MASKSGIPSWQRADAPSSTPPSATQPTTSSSSDRGKSDERESLHEGAEGLESEEDTSCLNEQAAKFLDDPALRDGPTDQKVDFLRSKGVDEEAINGLLGQVANEDVTMTSPETREKAWSMSPSLNQDAAPSRHAPRDIPPIVTYPEFLAQPVQQPPLVTTQRLLNTAYISGGLVATIYGLSKYVIGPMAHNLAESRHDFASHTQGQLDQLNTRLKEAASVDPASKSAGTTLDASDVLSEADSDPTELFHRDFATQTTPTLSRRSSLSKPEEPKTTVETHESRLKSITTQLETLSKTRDKAQMSNDTLSTRMTDLTTYLADLAQQNQHYSGSGGFYGTNYSKDKDGKVDQIESFKSDIRAVKGVFLSARNFPAGARNAVPATRFGT